MRKVTKDTTISTLAEKRLRDSNASKREVGRASKNLKRLQLAGTAFPVPGLAIGYAPIYPASPEAAGAAGEQFESGVPVALLAVARRDMAHGYTLEPAVPVSSLGDLTLTGGRVLGLNWLLSGDDDGASYDSRLRWLGQSTTQADTG